LSWRSFRSSLDYWDVHSNIPWLDLRDGSSAAPPGRPTGGEQCSDLLAERGAVLIPIWFDPADDGDCGNEAVASAGNIDNESIPVSSVTQRPAPKTPSLQEWLDDEGDWGLLG